MCTTLARLLLFHAKIAKSNQGRSKLLGAIGLKATDRRLDVLWVLLVHLAEFSVAMNASRDDGGGGNAVKADVGG